MSEDEDVDGNDQSSVKLNFQNANNNSDHESLSPHPRVPDTGNGSYVDPDAHHEGDLNGDKKTPPQEVPHGPPHSESPDEPSGRPDEKPQANAYKEDDAQGIPSYGGSQRSDTQEKLGEYLHRILGPEISAQLAESLSENSDVIKPGLNVIATPLHFALVWLKQNLVSGGNTPTLNFGSEVQIESNELIGIASTFSDNEAIVITLDSSVGGTFFHLNPNFSHLNNICERNDLRMVLVLTQSHLKRIPWSTEQDTVIRDVMRSTPDPISLLNIVALHEELEELQDVYAEHIDLDGIAPALTDLRSGDRSAFSLYLADLKVESARYHEEEASADPLSVRFNELVTGKKTQDPSAAAALYLGAHFGGIRSDIFLHMMEILRLAAIICWGDREPELSPSGEWVQRPWPAKSDDQALDKVGLRFKRHDRSGRLQARFRSYRASGFYGRKFSENAPRLNSAFFQTVAASIRPLIFGDELREPFADLVAQRIRDEMGQRPDVDGVVTELVEIVDLHRRTYDQAKEHLLASLQALGSPTDLVQAVNQHLDALQDEERATEAARHESPYFVSSVLDAIYAQYPEDRSLAVEALAERVGAHLTSNDSERDQFWRRLIISLCFRMNPGGAFAQVQKLFCDHWPVAGLIRDDISPAAIDGFRYAQEQIVEALISAHYWVLEADRHSVEWRFSVYLQLLMVWMHTAADMASDDKAKRVTGSQLSESFARLLLDRKFVDTLRQLNEAQARIVRLTNPNHDDAAIAMDAGTTSFRLCVALLRMLFGLSSGREYKLFATEIDQVDLREINFYNKIRWMARKTRDLATHRSDLPRLEELDRFSTWIEYSLGNLATALIAVECDLAGADPAQRTICAIEASPDKSYARRRLSNAPDWWRFSFSAAFNSGAQDEKHIDQLKRRDRVLRQMAEAS